MQACGGGRRIASDLTDSERFEIRAVRDEQQPAHIALEGIVQSVVRFEAHPFARVIEGHSEAPPDFRADDSIDLRARMRPSRGLRKADDRIEDRHMPQLQALRATDHHPGFAAESRGESGNY